MFRFVLSDKLGSPSSLLRMQLHVFVMGMALDTDATSKFSMTSSGYMTKFDILAVKAASFFREKPFWFFRGYSILVKYLEVLLNAVFCVEQKRWWL